MCSHHRHAQHFAQTTHFTVAIVNHYRTNTNLGQDTTSTPVPSNTHYIGFPGEAGERNRPVNDVQQDMLLSTVHEHKHADRHMCIIDAYTQLTDDHTICCSGTPPPQTGKSLNIETLRPSCLYDESYESPT